MLDQARKGCNVSLSKYLVALIAKHRIFCHEPTMG